MRLNNERQQSRERIRSSGARTAEVFTAYILKVDKYGLFTTAYVLLNVIATVREKLKMNFAILRLEKCQ
jgi:hypothetical protein